MAVQLLDPPQPPTVPLGGGGGGFAERCTKSSFHGDKSGKSEELMNGMEEEGQIPLPFSCFFVIPKSENGKKNSGIWSKRCLERGEERVGCRRRSENVLGDQD